MDNQNEKDRTNVSSSFLNNRKKTKPVDHTLTEKFKNITDKNRIIQPVNPFSHFSDNNEVEQKEPSTIEKKVGGTAITALTGGLIHGKAAEETAGFVSKHKKVVLLVAIAPFIVILLIVVAIIAYLSESKVSQPSINDYVTNNTTSEKELLDELKYYGYCTTDDQCKDSNSYRMANKLRELRDKFSQPCSGIGPGYDHTKSDACGIELNTALIIETLNYYQRSTGDIGNLEIVEEDNKTLFDILVSFIKRIVQKIFDLIGYEKVLADIETLARAQTEFVEQKCLVCEEDEKTGQKECHWESQYYYQLSSNKYVSYLLYGETSTHPNIQYDAPVVVYSYEDSCPIVLQNDMISTSYEYSNKYK